MGPFSTSVFLRIGIIIAIGAGARAFAEAPVYQPVSLGEGPILLFKQPKRDSKELALYLFDPSTHEIPHLLWQDDYHPNPRPLKRISPHLLILEFKERLHLLDVTSGVVSPLLPGIKDAQELLAVEKEEFFILRNTVETRGGYELGTGADGKTIVKEFPEPRKLLYRYKIAGKQNAKQVSPIHIQKVLQVTKDGFLVITASPARSIALIGRDGSTKKIAPFDPSWVAVATRHQLSPNRNYLALGILTVQQDFHEERTLMVYDLTKNRVCFKDVDIPLGPNLFSGGSMFLDLHWEDGKILGYGGPFASFGSRFLDVEKAARVEMPPQPLAQPEPQEKKTRRGKFDLAFGEVYYAGDVSPIGSVLDERGVGVRDLAVDMVGNWAAYCGQDDVLYLINGQKSQKRRLHPGWAHDLMWLDEKAK